MSEPMPLEPRQYPAINPNVMAALEAQEEIDQLLARAATINEGIRGLAAAEDLEAVALRFHMAARRHRTAHLLIQAERTAAIVARQGDVAEHVSPLRRIQ